MNDRIACYNIHQERNTRILQFITDYSLAKEGNQLEAAASSVRGDTEAFWQWCFYMFSQSQTTAGNQNGLLLPH